MLSASATARKEVLRERAAELRELLRVQLDALDSLLHGVYCSRVLVRREELAHLRHAVRVHKAAHQRLNKIRCNSLIYSIRTNMLHAVQAEGIKLNLRIQSNNLPLTRTVTESEQI